jgi:hypothetical protein
MGYSSIKRIQRRTKRLIGNSFTVIEELLHDWIWKPKCNDISIGIRPRLDMEFLGIVNAITPEIIETKSIIEY